MALKDLRDRFKAKLAAVEGVGVVHDYQRWSNEWGKFLDHFKDADGKINGCCFTRSATPSERVVMPYLDRNHTFLIRYYYGLNDADATELFFQDLLEDIQDAFDSEYNWDDYAVNSGPMQITVVDNRVFGSVLCHYAELTYWIEERVSY